MLTIINFVPKIQALDKSTATLAEIRSQIPGTRVMSIISLTETNRSERVESLAGLLAEVSDDIAFVGNHPSFDAAYDFLHGDERSVSRVPPQDLIAHVEGFVLSEHRTLFLSPVGKGIGNVGDLLLAWAKDSRVAVVGYFKSLHDQGWGLSSPMTSDVSDIRVLDGLRKIASRLSRQRVISRRLIPDKLGPEHADLLMVFNDYHRQLVAEKVRSATVFESGYPLLYPAWRELVAKSSFCQEFVREAALEVVLFTRGETPGRMPEENVVSHANLEVLLNDITSGLERSGKDWRMRIKPHPIQDLAVLANFASQRSKVEVTFEAPSLLAATTDLAIATYSSTVVDTLALGVPTIEYFFETQFFRKKHPTGSPFPAFGALMARNQAEFTDCLQMALRLSGDFSPALQSLSTTPDFLELELELEQPAEWGFSGKVHQPTKKS